MRFSLMMIAAVAGGFVLGNTASADPINLVDPGTLSTTDVEDFESFEPGNYDEILVGLGISFAERFVGQTVTFDGDFDVVTGKPDDPLTLQVGDPNENLDVLSEFGGPNVLTGLGPLGFPEGDAIAEGAVAILLDGDHFELGIDIVGAGGGDAQFDFFRRDGSLIDSITLSGLQKGSFAFRREGDVQDIAGVVITNTDSGGIGYDNVQYIVQGCRWDCGGDDDGNVGIVDFLVLLAQWGTVDATCDFGLGAPGVGIEEFLNLLANWGPCA